MKNIEIYKSRLISENLALAQINEDMLAEIGRATAKAVSRAHKRAMRHLRSVQLLSRIIDDHNIKTEIENMTFVSSVLGVKQ